MAVTQFAFCQFRHQTGVPAQAAHAAGATFEIKTPSGSSGATTAAAVAGQTICRVSTDTAVYVAFGASPTASSTAGFYLPANASDCFIVQVGDKGAVITA